MGHARKRGKRRRAARTGGCERRRPMSQQHIIKILAIDDHDLIREGIATVIRSQRDMELIAQASSGIEAIQMYRQHQPDIALMDLRMPGLSGIDATIEICAD